MDAYKLSTLCFFTDDTSIFFKRRPTSDELNTEIRSDSQWLHQNKLELNESKIFAMNLFQTKASTNYQNCAVQKCNTYKYLGVIIDANLTFEAHVESIYLKLKKWVEVIACLWRTCSLDVPQNYGGTKF